MISVVVPRAGDCPHRARAWQWVRDQYPFEVVEGFGDPDEWRKADAVADALTRATGDLLVIADADVWSDNLAESIAAVEEGAPWAIPHTHIRRLTEEGTAQFIGGDRTAEVEENHYATQGGGIVVIARETYEQIPLDRRFVGWGGEDKSWGYALHTIVGRAAVSRGFLWHLWHPPQQRLTRKVGSEQNEALHGRYRAALRNRRAMRALIEEAKCHSPASSPALPPSSR